MSLKMPKNSSNASASFQSGLRLKKMDPGDVAWFSLFVLVGGLAILHPFGLLGGIAAAVGLGLCWLALVYLRRQNLEVWQMLLLVAMTATVTVLAMQWLNSGPSSSGPSVPRPAYSILGGPA